jgi:3-hydroxybutyryl-CoA dehydrogenase
MEIQQAAVIGGGTAGRGVARVLAAAGIEVQLVEATGVSLDESMQSLREALNRDIGRWAVTETERDATLSRISGYSELPDFAGTGLIVEAIHEDPKEKRALLGRLDMAAPESTLLFLNTSTLSITELSAAVRPERRGNLLGLHFLHPVSRTPLVELIRGLHTSDSTAQAARALATRLGKEVIEVAEYPGYVSTRLTLVLINEAIHVLMEGVATRDAVDRAMRLRLGSSHGPLALADEIGLDSVHRALESLWQELGLAQFRPAPLLRRMVTDGWLGEKSGRGFYRYDPTGRRIAETEDLSRPAVAHGALSDPDGN